MIPLEEMPEKIRETTLNAYDRGLHDGAIALIRMLLDEVERLGLSQFQRAFLEKMHTELAQDRAKLP